VLRFLGGHVVIQIDIHRSAWLQSDREEDEVAVGVPRNTEDRCFGILRSIPLFVISAADVAYHMPDDYGHAMNIESSHFMETFLLISSSFEVLERLGFGRVLYAGTRELAFQKLSWRHLPEHSRSLLIQNGVQPRSFNGHRVLLRELQRGSRTAVLPPESATTSAGSTDE
jgi:hypothetical protein